MRCAARCSICLVACLIATPALSAQSTNTSADSSSKQKPAQLERVTVADIEFLGEVTFPTGFTYDGTIVGGLSGLTYEADTGRYFAISDDRSQFGPARFYALDIDVADGALDAGDVTFTDVTTIKRLDGTTFPPLFIDPEGIALYGQLVSNPGHAAGALGMMANWDLPQLEKDLPHLKTPLSLIVGSNDQTISPRQAAWRLHVKRLASAS